MFEYQSEKKADDKSEATSFYDEDTPNEAGDYEEIVDNDEEGAVDDSNAEENNEAENDEITNDKEMENDEGKIDFVIISVECILI